MISDFCDLCKELVASNTKEKDYLIINEIISFSTITSNSLTIKQRKNVKYGTVDELFDEVNPSNDVKMLYKKIEADFTQLHNVDLKVTMGEKRVIFYVKKNDRTNNFAMVEFRKSSLVIAAYLPEIYEAEMKEKTGLPVKAHHSKCHVNQVTSEEIINKIFPYIKKAYDLAYERVSK